MAHFSVIISLFNWLVHVHEFNEEFLVDPSGQRYRKFSLLFVSLKNTKASARLLTATSPPFWVRQVSASFKGVW